MTVKIQIRRDTSANWSLNNPTLEAGEPGLETDTKRVKYGDGATTWNNLTYALSGNIYTANIIDLTTANVTELTNLYFTNARVYSNVISIGYAPNSYVNTQLSTINATLLLKANTADLTSDNVSQGTENFYFTNTRAVYALTGGEGVNIDANGLLTASLESSNISNFNFQVLDDVSAASLSVDQIAYPAIAKLSVTNSGSSAYRFSSHYGTTNNPNVYVISGTTISFNLGATGHPFLLREDDGNGFTNVVSGLVHITTTGNVSIDSNAQGFDTGTLYFNVPFGTSNSYQYICSVHGSMVGNIVVKDISAI